MVSGKRNGQDGIIRELETCVFPACSKVNNQENQTFND